MGNHAAKPKFFDISRLDDVNEERDPLDPKWEMYSQALVRYCGDFVKAANECLDPLVDPIPSEEDGVPVKVRGRVKYLLNRAASETVATRREVEMFLTRVIRNDESIRQRSDARKIMPMDAVKELCKMKGWYSPVEIRNTHEIVVPDSIRRMSDEELMRIASQARGEVLDAEVVEPMKLEADDEWNKQKD